MLSARKRWTTQRSLMLLGLCLVLYHLAIYRPLCRYADEVDKPLTDTWKRLLQTSPFAQGLDAGYSARIQSGLDQAREASRGLEEVRRQAWGRIELDPAVREKMDRPFQLIEFQNDRQVRLEELARLAAQAKVGLGPGVAEGFPEYTAGRRDPALLWPQLAVAHHAVAAALQAQASTVSVVRLAPMVFHPASTNANEWLVEIPVRMELAAPAAVVERLLEALPLRPDEIKARGLPEALPGKPVLFLNGLLMRKENRDRPDYVHAEVSVSSLVVSARGGPEP